MVKPLLAGDPVRERLERISRPLREAARCPEIEWTFFLLDSGDLFASSDADGHLILSRGLLNFLGGDEGLEFALGHEIAHVAFGHVNQDQEARVSPNPPSYSEEQRQRADSWTAEQMQKLGRTRREILILLRRLDRYASNQGIRAGAPEDPESIWCPASVIANRLQRLSEKVPALAD